MGNMLKTAVLLGVLTSLLIVIGGAVGGQQGMVVAFVLALVMNFASYWFSDRIVLSMYRAQPVTEGDAPDLYRTVRTLATRAGLPMPRVFIIPDDTPNAFATGRNPEHAAVAVTAGIMRMLSDEELEGVLAHELAHVKNRDTLIMTISATLAGAITYLAHMAQFAAMFGGMRRNDDEEGHGGGALSAILMAVLAPIAAMLIQMAISRSREFQADATGARIAGRPWGLARALEKMDMASQMRPMHATPSTAHLFIVNPLSGGGIASLFSTHPPIAERIARLRAMATV
ncbi:MAG: zinc metalloprotease HtpX [Candidatus Rokubacteria bacterium]|nr:zinc metalloprotease HtpX [Candidatus Rokubacteria bacterium]